MRRLTTFCAALATGAALAGSAAAAELPKATEALLQSLKLQPSILQGLDEELNVPAAWVEAAKKEGAVKIYTTMRPREWAKMHAILKERYPYITFEHDEVNTAQRRYIRPLTAFREGRILTDVVMGLSGNVYLFRQIGAFERLDDLPTYKHLADETKQHDHIAVAGRTRYWCMSYNTKLVKKEDLPKTWDDLVNSKRFADKKLMIGNRPNNWLLNLWEANGEEWGREFTRKLFANLDPQLRKEGLSAVLSLVSLGEGQMATPSAMERVAMEAKKGAPVAFHCPEPVPLTISEIGVFKGSPRIHAAKIFVNWYLSKEGQVAQFAAIAGPPSHQGLFGPEFLDYPDEVKGKKMAVLGDNAAETSKKLAAYWNDLWQKGGGTPDPAATAEP